MFALSLSSLRPLAFAGLAVSLAVSTASAAYLIEVDIDGADDGVLTFNPHFSFGADTTIASQSAAGGAFGLTGGDSIFGGDGVNFPDTYLYRYNPAIDSDNLVIPAGTDLGDGELATGILGGNPGLYAVYATWPYTDNVSGGLTDFSVQSDDDSFFISLDQNSNGDKWIKLGEILWSSGTVTVAQSSQSNTFVSMRSAGVLFESLSDFAVPEPSAAALLGIPLLLGLLARHRRQ